MVTVSLGSAVAVLLVTVGGTQVPVFNVVIVVIVVIALAMMIEDDLDDDVVVDFVVYVAVSKQNAW